MDKSVTSVLKLSEPELLETAHNGATKEEFIQHLLKRWPSLDYEETKEHVERYGRSEREVRELVHAAILKEAQEHSPYPAEKELQDIRKRNAPFIDEDWEPGEEPD